MDISGLIIIVIIFAGVGLWLYKLVQSLRTHEKFENIFTKKNSTLTCSRCQSKISEQDRFCPKCSMPLKGVPICPYCGRKVNKHDDICLNCGASLYG